MAPLNEARSTSHYTVLDLPQKPAVLPKADVKVAYHRALLKHHPDKSGPSKPNTTPRRHLTPGISSTNPIQTYTIDEITAAYKILSNPVARAEYDQSLRLSGRLAWNSAFSAEGEGEGDIRTGLEVFDLDDMKVEAHKQRREQNNGLSNWEDEVTTWYRSCRCGDEKGFLVQEDDLEREVERGEIMVGCRGCSLWAKVVFAVDEQQSHDEARS